MATPDSMLSRFKLLLFPAKVSEVWIAIFIAILGIITLPILLVVSNGDSFISFGFLIAIALIFFTSYRFDWGFLIIVGLVLISDSYLMPGNFYLETINQSMLVLKKPNPGVGVLTPLEMHVLLLLLVWIVVGVTKRNFNVDSVPNKFVAILFFVSLIGSCLYGISRGGDVLMAIWEIRALPFLVLLLFFVPQVIKTKEQVHSLVWVCILTIAFKAFQAIEGFAELGFEFGEVRTLTNHEDAVFFVLLFLLLAAFYLFGGETSQRRWLAWLSIPILFGFYLANRRAAYASFAVSVIAFYLLLHREHQRRLRNTLIIFSFFFGIYLVSFWNSDGRLAMVAQAVRSTLFSHDMDAVSWKDYTSTLAREQENYNLAVTFRKAPVVGIGFGNKHEFPIMNYGEFKLKGYITHNEILWLLVKSGAIGYYVFFLFLNLIVLYGAMTFTNLNDPYLKAVCAICVIAVLNQIVASYVDMQLTFPRNMFFLGVLIGLVPVIKSIDQRLSISTP